MEGAWRRGIGIRAPAVSKWHVLVGALPASRRVSASAFVANTPGLKNSEGPLRGDDFSIANGIDELGAILTLAHNAAMACAVLSKRYDAAVVHDANTAGQRQAACQIAALEIISEIRLGSMSFGEFLDYPEDLTESVSTLTQLLMKDILPSKDAANQGEAFFEPHPAFIALNKNYARFRSPEMAPVIGCLPPSAQASLYGLMTFMHATDADVLRGIHQGVRSTFTEARVGLRCRNTVINILSIATTEVRKQAPVLSIPADQAINLCISPRPLYRPSTLTGHLTCSRMASRPRYTKHQNIVLGYHCYTFRGRAVRFGTQAS